MIAPENASHEKLVTLLVDRGVEICLERAITPGALESAILNDAPPDAVRYLAECGWRHLVNQALHHRRGRIAAGENGRLSNGTHPAHGRNPDSRWAALNVPVQVDDGTLRRLIDFTREDARHLGEVCRAQVAGWSRRAEIADRIDVLLGEQHRARVAQLNSAAKDELSELVARAWG